MSQGEKLTGANGEARLQHEYYFSLRPSGQWAKEFNTAAAQAEGKDAYEASIIKIGSFSTVEQFWRIYGHMLRPSSGKSDKTMDIHLFKNGIKPIWEDDANKRGGKWIVRMPKGLTARFWEQVVLSLIGEQFGVGNEICGAVLSIRFNEDIIAIWNRDASHTETLHKIRNKLYNILRLPEFVKLDYKPHDRSLQETSGDHGADQPGSNRSGGYSGSSRGANGGSFPGYGPSGGNSGTGYRGYQHQYDTEGPAIAGPGGYPQGGRRGGNGGGNRAYQGGGRWNNNRSRGGGYRGGSNRHNNSNHNSDGSSMGQAQYDRNPRNHSSGSGMGRDNKHSRAPTGRWRSLQ